MKRNICFLLFLVMLLSTSACKAAAAQNISSALEESISSESVFSTEQSESNSSSQESSPSSASQSFNTLPSSLSSSSLSRSNSISSGSISPSPTVPAGKAIVFDDPVFEKLLRNFINKPTGTCYDSDFSALSFSGGTSSIYLEHLWDTNRTTLFDSNTEKHSDVDGMPASFAVLSQIPVRDLTYSYFIPSTKTDIALTFDMSWVTASHELVSFVFKGMDSVPNRTSLLQYMTFTNFNTISTCANLKSLFLWDCKGVSLDSISGLRNLEVVSLGNCNITSLEPLRNSKKLWKLILCYNNVTDFSPLANNPALSWVYLAGLTGTIDVDSLITCPALKTLDLEECRALTDAQKGKLAGKGITVREYSPIK